MYSPHCLDHVRQKSCHFNPICRYEWAVAIAVVLTLARKMEETVESREKYFPRIGDLRQSA